MEPQVGQPLVQVSQQPQQMQMVMPQEMIDAIATAVAKAVVVQLQPMMQGQPAPQMQPQAPQQTLWYSGTATPVNNALSNINYVGQQLVGIVEDAALRITNLGRGLVGLVTFQPVPPQNLR